MSKFLKNIFSTTFLLWALAVTAVVGLAFAFSIMIAKTPASNVFNQFSKECNSVGGQIIYTQYTISCINKKKEE